MKFGEVDNGSPKDIALAIKKLAMYEASKYRTSIIFAKVIKADNVVEVETFDGLKLGGAMLVLSMFCKERTIKIPYDESADDDEDKASHVHDEDEMLGTLTINHTSAMGCSLTFTGDENLTCLYTPATPSSPGSGTITFRHKHKIHPNLPEIKLWRGLVEGDIVVISEMGNGQYYVHERASIKDGNSNEILNPKEDGFK